jgi:hypothetical protein
MPRKGGVPENLKPFKKGNDERRNMKGAPVKIPTLEILLAEVLGEEREGTVAAKAILSALRNKALKGDTRAAELLLDRAYGKAKQTIDQNTNLQALTINLINPEDINKLNNL